MMRRAIGVCGRVHNSDAISRGHHFGDKRHDLGPFVAPNWRPKVYYRIYPQNIGWSTWNIGLVLTWGPQAIKTWLISKYSGGL